MPDRIRRILILGAGALALAGIGPARHSSAAPCGQMVTEIRPVESPYVGCPWDGGLAAAAHGKYRIAPMPTEVARPILAFYNHTDYGCRFPADRIVAATSTTADGKLYYLNGRTLAAGVYIDRNQLRGLLNGTAGFDPGKPPLAKCPQKS